MQLPLLLLLFSSGAFSYFLPLKETQHVRNETPTIITEMLCLLEAENKSTGVKFSKPLDIKNKSCAHSITQTFIRELGKVPMDECMKRVQADMKVLEGNCTVLRKSSSIDKECSKVKNESFTIFKESLEEFLQWINEKGYCHKLPRGTGFYLGGKCGCRDKWKDHKGLL